MPQKYLAAAIQMHSGSDKSENLCRLERSSKRRLPTARFIALPEMFNCLGPWPAMLEAAEPIPGPTSRFLSELAERLQVVLVGGSFCERDPLDGRVYNTSLLFDAAGKQFSAIARFTCSTLICLARSATTRASGLQPARGLSSPRRNAAESVRQFATTCGSRNCSGDCRVPRAM